MSLLTFTRRGAIFVGEWHEDLIVDDNGEQLTR